MQQSLHRYLHYQQDHDWGRTSQRCMQVYASVWVSTCQLPLMHHDPAWGCMLSVLPEHCTGMALTLGYPPVHEVYALIRLADMQGQVPAGVYAVVHSLRVIQCTSWSRCARTCWFVRSIRRLHSPSPYHCMGFIQDQVAPIPILYIACTGPVWTTMTVTRLDRALGRS